MKENMQSGRSMIEMMGVLAIIGVLSVGGFSMMTKISNSRKTNAIIDEISALAGKARSVIREYDDGYTGDEYSGLSGFLQHSRAYPDSVEWDASCNCFVGTDDVSYTLTYNKTNSSLFEMDVDGLSAETCMDVVSTNWGSVGTNGFVKLTIGTKTSSTPLGIGDASDVCDDDASVKFTFR